MAQTSRFASKPILRVNSPAAFEQKHFDLSKGLNLYSPDETMPDEATPFVRNARLYPRDDDENRVPVRTRKGPGFYSVPIGEVLDTQDDTASDGDEVISSATSVQVQFTAGDNARLTKVELKIKNPNGATGPVIVEIYDDDGGAPDTLLATSSIAAEDIFGTYSYLAAHFIEAPLLVDTDDYWIKVKQQDNGSGEYNVASASGSLNYKIYLSTSGGVKGVYRYYQADGTAITVFAHGTSLYQIDDLDGSTTVINNSLSANATKYRFATVNNDLYYVNGVDKPRKWDGTTDSEITDAAVSTHIIQHKSRLYYVSVSVPTLLIVSEDGTADPDNFDTFDALDQINVPAANTGDPITALASIQDNLVIWTRNTKYVLYGSNSADWVLRKSPALQGAVNQEVVQTHRNYAYFLSDDGVYQYNGTTEEIISTLVAQEIDTSSDKTRAFADIQDNKYRLYYPSSGSGDNDRCLVWDLLYESWWLDSITLGASHNFFKETRLAQGSTFVGAIYYGEEEESDLGKPIHFEYRTRYFTYDSPASFKKIRRLYPVFRTTGDFDVRMQVDKDFSGSPTEFFINLAGSGITFDSGSLYDDNHTYNFIGLATPRFTLGGDGKYIQYRVKRTGVDTPVEFIGFSTVYKVKRLR